MRTRRFAAAAIAACALLATPALIGAQLVAPASAATPTPTPTISYPTTTAPGQVTKATILTGDRVGFSGGGFEPGSGVAIAVQLPSGGRGQAAVVAAASAGTVRTSGSGTFGIVVRLTTLGVTTLTATGKAPNGATLVDVAIVTVLPRSKATTSASPSPSSSGAASSTATAIASGGGGSGGGGGSDGSGGLPQTGADGVGPELWLAGGLIAVGGAALFLTVARRRTRVPR